MANIKSAKFIKSEASADNYAGFNMAEIAVVGRSNVGKSSFINMLANNKKLAKTSSTPGRTRLVNFFEFVGTDNTDTQKFMLVDLPGYGYAKASASEQNRWKDMIEGYLNKTTNLKNIILLVDIRHEPAIKDLQMFDYLFRCNINTTVVATKHDKLNKSQVHKNVVAIAKAFKIGIDNIFVTSSETKFGRDQIINRIWQFVVGGQNEDLGD